jgi:branched-chain amino acid transport system substrate-binding protein
MNRRDVLVALLGSLASPSYAQTPDRTVKIGVLGDSTSVFAATSGAGSILAAQMAAEDFMKINPSIKVEIIAADHQNKPDIAAGIARRWFDLEKVDAITDLSNSAVALAVNEVAREKRKAALVTASASIRLTGENCSPSTVNWTFETNALANGTAQAIMSQGLKKWFFVTVNYTFGTELEELAKTYITSHGGEVVGNVRFPLGTPDFASFILQAQASSADLVAFVCGGSDASNAGKQLVEFGLQKKKKVAIIGATIIDMMHMGPKAAGLYVLTMFYWDRTPQSRAWTERYAARLKNGLPPTMMQAGTYAVVTHYLKAVLAANSTDGVTVVETMKKMPTDDPLFGAGYIRADGRKIHPVYLVEVKPPSEGKFGWDIYDIVREIPGDDAFLPLNESKCRLLNN